MEHIFLFILFILKSLVGSKPYWVKIFLKRNEYQKKKKKLGKIKTTEAFKTRRSLVSRPIKPLGFKFMRTREERKEEENPFLGSDIPAIPEVQEQDEYPSSIIPKQQSSYKG
jgi:hypothetical protein